MQYRYPGPKPRSREVAVVMLADAVESAARAMADPTASRLENLVHELAMKRLLDGQFDECDLTMRELELIERSLTKTMLGIYHGRIAYPSTTPSQSSSPVPEVGLPAVKTA
jgi:cyclic-di-AMP phosphodiesterase PgpH